MVMTSPLGQSGFSRPYLGLGKKGNSVKSVNVARRKTTTNPNLKMMILSGQPSSLWSKLCKELNLTVSELKGNLSKQFEDINPNFKNDLGNYLQSDSNFKSLLTESEFARNGLSNDQRRYILYRILRDHLFNNDELSILKGLPNIDLAERQIKKLAKYLTEQA
ncbi:MAG: hypothetical protein LW817_02455 [Candidatus Caenarcaniphilales bacterium]|jgi:hypothetical protein|nr:hypothetical protein [Candidatus Caenarcaniphilales bacterium]